MKATNHSVNASKLDVYDIITERIIALLESGSMGWLKFARVTLPDGQKHQIWVFRKAPPNCYQTIRDRANAAQSNPASLI